LESALSATELALVAKVQPQTASSHLSRLSDAGVVCCDRRGRQRFYRLANRRIVKLLEAFNETAQSRALVNYRPHPEIAQARTCYDHLAGWLGASLTTSLLEPGHLRAHGKDFDLQPSGERFLTDLGVDVAAARQQRRLFARCCLDWTETSPHLRGALGAALADHCFGKRWITQRNGERRVRMTAAGHRALPNTLA